ncbi:MAG: hypothetical protein ACU826_09885 [Gammaproteobacteria bacterium]
MTRFSNRDDYDSKVLWHQVKKPVRQAERENAALIFDDTILEKLYTEEND